MKFNVFSILDIFYNKKIRISKYQFRENNDQICVQVEIK